MRFRDFYADLKVHARADAPRNPAVSVILPTYARAHGPLQRSIDSVLSQSFEDFELIVVDDGSRDGTEDVLADYQRRDPRVVIHRFHGNSGLPALRVNQGILASKGRYIAYQFDDDVWTPESLEVRIKEIIKRAEPAVAYGSADISRLLPSGEIECIRLGQPYNYSTLQNGNYIANNAVLHSRGVFGKAGLYDPHIVARRYSDYDLWLRLGAHVDFFWVDHKVADVFAAQEASLGQTAHLDWHLRRLYLHVPRSHLLTPEAINDYDPHSLISIAPHFSQLELFSIAQKEITQFLSSPFDYFDNSVWQKITTLRRTHRRIVCISQNKTASMEICVRQFCDFISHAFSFVYVPEYQASHFDFSSANIDIFFRTYHTATNRLTKRESRHRPTIYAMDDNLLRLHELGQEFQAYAPGGQNLQNITSQIKDVDLAISYSPISKRDVAALNSRVTQLKTSIPLEFLASRHYARSRKIKYALISGGHRKNVIKDIWPALYSFASQRPDDIEFEFWGIEPDFEPKLPCTTSYKPFNYSYERYLRALLETSIDVVLVPLEGGSHALGSKCPVKFLEGITAGAICIFSDVDPYRELPVDTCLRAENTIAAWDRALEESFLLGAAERADMLERARAVAIEKFSTESQIYDFLATIDAASLHARLDGRAVLFIFHETALGGATLHLLRHAQMIQSLGFTVVGLVPETSPNLPSLKERWSAATNDSTLRTGQWRSGYQLVDGDWTQRAEDNNDDKCASALRRNLLEFDIGLVHAATWQPVATRLAKRLNVPCVYSLHAFYETPAGALTNIADAVHCSSSRYARVWEKEIGAPARRIVCPVDDELFRMHEKNRNRPVNRPVRILVSGTLQPRKNQLEAIRAVKKLVADGHDVELDLIGYSQLHSSYSDECLAEVENGLAARVRLHDFVDDVKRFYDHHADILLMASTDESMPQVILQAMAAGVLVVSTDVGGVTELIKHRYSGVIARGPAAQDLAEALSYALSLTPEQRREIIDRAFRVISCLGKSTYVRAELIDLYNQACEVHAARNPDAVRDLTDILNTARPAAPAIPQPQEAAPAAIRIETISAHDPVQADGTFWQKRHFEIAAPGGIVSGLSMTIAAEGNHCRHLLIRVGAAIRPDIVLRSAELSLPADGTPKQVSVRFAPISVVKGQALRVEIEAEDGDVLAYRPAGDGASTVALLDEPHRA